MPDTFRFSRVGAWLVALVVLCAIGDVAYVASGRLHRDGPAAEYFAYRAADAGELPELWQVPSFAFTDHRRAPVTRDSLRGKPFIADFVFTQCTNACPILTSRMVQLQRRLSGRELHFVSISVDPAHDDIGALSRYAEQWNPMESRWSLLATDEPRLAEIVAGFRVTAEKSNDLANPIIHSNVFFLVDAASYVRGVYASDDPAALDRLVRDASSLAVGHAPARGASYATLGCAGCHENAKLAPPLFNLDGAERELASGMRVVIDRAYLERAIVEPGTELVKGYLPLMSSYRADLSDAQVDVLVDELLARKSDEAAAPSSAELVTDPVCKMRVRAAPDGIHAVHAGRTFHFCSEQCRDRFVAAPVPYQ